MPAEDELASDQDMSALEQGEAAARELREAISLTGVAVPSLIGGFPTMGKARVELGGMSAESARALAAWIRSHA